MKYLGLFTLAALSMAAADGTASSEAAFETAAKALAANDFPRALGAFEVALSADPDNVRYASEYRQAVIRQAKALHPKEGQPEDFERCLKFFERLVAEHPKSANAYLNYGFAHVDKIPAAGAISQVILANSALTQFTKAVELRPSWIALYTRGNSYLFWPRIFGRTSLGVADLEKALAIQKSGPKKNFYARAYIALGDGYWKTDNLDKARAVWKEGLAQFPNNAALKTRLAKQGDELKALIEATLDPSQRVDTDLRDLWTDQ